jgi:ATP synthase F1 delta subunit
MLSLTTRVARSPLIQLVRTASTAATDHKPLVTIHGLHARYANATYVVASKAGKLKEVEEELAALLVASNKSKKFSAILQNPMISRDDKTKYVASLDKLSQTTRNLLITMAGNARLSELPKVASTFAQLMKARRGQVDARIISAVPLTAAQLAEIEKAMQSQVPAGKSVILHAETDPSIVGGLQVQIGDQFLDLSVKSRIAEIGSMSVD